MESKFRINIWPTNLEFDFPTLLGAHKEISNYLVEDMLLMADLKGPI